MRRGRHRVSTKDACQYVCVTSAFYHSLTRADDIDSAIKSLLNLGNLAKKAKIVGIDRVIRPRAPVGHKQKASILKKVAGKRDKTQLAAEGIKAVVGAVYYDGGYSAAKSVIGTLGLVLFDEDVP